VLSYPRLKFVPNEIRRFLELLRAASLVVEPTQTAAASPDEPDNRFLECAEAPGTAFLFTSNSNKRHFPK